MNAQATEVITRSEVAAQRKLVPRFAERYGVDQDKLLSTLKHTAFKIKDGEVSTEQMMALLVVAEAHGLNPFTREIFAFPSQNGIVPVVSVDGWAKLVNSHPQFNGWEFEQDDEKCVCTIYRKDREHPTKITEYMQECKRGSQPWQSHPKRMLRHKALIQAARYAFSFAGIYDPDEAEAIVQNEIDVTPEKPKLQLDAEGKPEFVNADGTPHVPTKKIGPKRMRAIVEGIETATKAQDGPGLLQILDELDNDEKLQVFQNLRSWEKTATRELERKAREAAGPAPHLAPWSLDLLAACQDLAAVTAAWSAIQGAYDANGTVPPGDIETVYIDRKKELTPP